MPPYRTALHLLASLFWQKFAYAFALTGALLVSTAASAQVREALSVESRQLGVNTRIEVLGHVFAGLPVLAGPQTRLVVYHRPGATRFAGAASVFVNDDYHTSLVQGGYSQLCLVPGEARMAVREIRVGGKPKDDVDHAIELTLISGQTQFMSIQEEEGRAMLKPVAPVQALQDMVGLRMQLHTISRVSKAQVCDVMATGALEQAPPAIAPVPLAANPPALTPVAQPAVKTEQVQLGGDALFAFGKSDHSSLVLAGRASLDELVQRIHQQYSTVQELRVIGHADPLGATALNDRLSLERANTVSQYLSQKVSMPGMRMQAEGRGASEPKVNCAMDRSPQSIACHQANRRVEINIIGLGR